MQSYVEYPFDSQSVLKYKKRIKREFLTKEGLLDKRIAILCGSTVGDIKDIIEVFLLSFGIRPTFFVGEYNRYYEESVFSNEALIHFKPDLVYIHTSFVNLSEGEDIYSKLCEVWTALSQSVGCPIIQNNFEQPPYGYLNNVENIASLNTKLYEYAKENRNLYINDINYLSARYGLDQWFNWKTYYLYKYALDVQAIPTLSHQVAKLIKSIFGRDHKCLVLDLDNTLWGGVVGDVGMQGIDLGAGSASGEAYVAFQRYVKKLYAAGIILAVCSKNDETVAKEAFNHPNMVIKLEDFSAFYANWDNKAANILKISEDLNILPESIVFIDDNPAEQELVRMHLPEVKVPRVTNVLDFVSHLDRGGYFNLEKVTVEDTKRNQYYKLDAIRNQHKQSFLNYDDYLESLKMVSRIESLGGRVIERAAQLINKTNQFNLTGTRITLEEVQKISDSTDYIALYATLDDMFGENGVVSVLIGEIVNRTLHVRTWVMSCRVFKRDLELAILDVLVEKCKQKQIECIVGYYEATNRNQYVSELYQKLGFIQIANGQFEFANIQNYLPQNKVIQIEEV